LSFRISPQLFPTVKSLSERLFSAGRQGSSQSDWLARGDKARDERYWPEAIAAYTEYLSHAPHDFNIWVQLGHAYKESGCLQDADQAYKHALSLEPNNSDLLLNLGHLRKLQDDIHAALGFYRQSFEIDGNEFAAAEIYSLAGRADHGNPERELAGYWRTRGDKARDEKRWEKAAEAYVKYLACTPNDFDIWVQLGHTYKESRAFKEADAAYNSALAFDNDNPDLLLNLGHLRKLQNDIVSAVDFYERSFKIDKNEFAAAEIRSITEAQRRIRSIIEAQRRPAENAWRDFFSSNAASRKPRQLDEEVALLRKSPLLNPIWYRKTYSDLGDTPIDVARHYLLHGAAEGRNPGPDFDTKFYLHQYSDVAAAGVNPLVHYIRYGAKEGRKRLLDSTIKYAVSDAHIECVRRVSLAPEVALFVTHSPDGRIRAHVKHYLRALVRHGICPILLIASDVAFIDRNDPVLDILGGVFVRQNIGFDFAAWAHALSLHAELYNVEILYLLNDSIIGPLNDNMFSVLLEQIRTSKADFFGLTDNYQLTWHVQSYFLGFKRSALQCDRLKDFFNSVVSYSDKTAVITQYETVLAPMLVRVGLKCHVLYPADSDAKTNHTIIAWKSLISRGFPFVKITTLRDDFPNVDINGWREILDAAGFDVSLAEQAVSRVRQTDVSASVNVPLSSPLLRGGELPQKPEPRFSPGFYLTLYPDIAAAGVDPYEHFTRHGRAEGRLSAVPGLDYLASLDLEKQLRDTVLVISHQATRGGCPILSYNIMKGFLDKYNVITLFLGPGPIIDACHEAGAIIVGPISMSGSPEIANFVIRQIIAKCKLKFAVANSIESRYVLPALAKSNVPSILLIHEFAAYVRPYGALRDAVLWAGKTIFSTPITRAAAIAEYPDLAQCDFPVMPQGRCVVPSGDFPDLEQRTAEINRIKRILRPNGFSPQGIVIIGLGQVEYRKGVDLFISCAERATQLAPDIPMRFIWIGRGYNPGMDVTYSAYLADQISRSGLDGKVEFLGETTELQSVYENSDLLLLSSRLDPLPNVAIDALDAGLPVLCFTKATGIAGILEAYGIGSNTVANYLDIEDMSHKIVSIASNRMLCEALSEKSKLIAAKHFNIQAYVEGIDELANALIERGKQEKADVETIIQAEVLRLDYYLSPGRQQRPIDDVVRDYVRSWAANVGCRKPFPGFHPGIYKECHGLLTNGADPLADYLRAGRPDGPWKVQVISEKDCVTPTATEARVALHVHAYYPDIFGEILARLQVNKSRPDLFVSVTDHASQQEVGRQLADAGYKNATIRIVPNRGRDIGPFITEFRDELVTNYDIIGHLHTKKTESISHHGAGETWYRFLLNNLLGGTAQMLDIILEQMMREPAIGIVFPDDPHVIGWDKNWSYIERLAPFLKDRKPQAINFPVGTMFWCRPGAIRTIFDLNLTWDDYPSEPLPYDGSILHGIERLFGVAPLENGYRCATTNRPGLTR
jgi:lipopolysaccharide biosynthesis protein/Flp pilus assembly protein TadD